MLYHEQNVYPPDVAPRILALRDLCGHDAVFSIAAEEAHLFHEYGEDDAELEPFEEQPVRRVSVMLASAEHISMKIPAFFETCWREAFFGKKTGSTRWHLCLLRSSASISTWMLWSIPGTGC